MSATRPAIEFSIGIIASAASPFTAAKQSSKVGRAGSGLGPTSAQAMWELAPGSPWNTTFFGFSMALAFGSARMTAAVA